MSRECQLTPLNPRYPTIRLKLQPQQRFRFGRRPECEQSFPNDFRISGVHATLLLDNSLPPNVLIEDSSVNGTFVNGVRVPRNQTCKLSSGDEIFLVIPNEKLLQHGYEGSLTTNFVGYYFSLADGQNKAPRVPPIDVRLDEIGHHTANWKGGGGPQAGLMPLEPPSPSEIIRQQLRHEQVRQTADAPSWLSRAIEGTDTPTTSSGNLPGVGRIVDGGGVHSGPPASFTLWWEQQPTLCNAPPIR
ncbi:hypothetical protein AB1Y20_023520 [Prymnesium parvum]|uniref:FHA domain-containing protein n=1 Tax=Prymnesium parvum TaxID=97485 RepID=A0AB34JHB0_PRYPA|mmetsp:Transcript_46128/g.105699  ORF Transcript_46128/g.105699 Transcript_46128/m.105699 type:complete len:245 (-) Transcript_46128:95-829(-)